MSEHEQDLNKNLDFVELCNQVEQLQFVVGVLLSDLQEILAHTPSIERYFLGKRVIYRNMVITYDTKQKHYLLNNLPMSLDLITQALERDNPELIPHVLALAPVFTVRSAIPRRESS